MTDSVYYLLTDVTSCCDLFLWYIMGGVLDLIVSVLDRFSLPF